MLENNIKDIDYRLLIVLIMGCFVSTEICLICTLFFVLLDIIKSDLKIKLKISIEFVLLWLIGIIMSFYNNIECNTYEIIRFSFYLLAPVIYFYFGYIIYKDNSIHTILKTICVAGIINILQVFANFIVNFTNFGLDYETFRMSKKNLTDLTVIMFFILVLKNKDISIFSNRKDKVILLFDTIILIITFSRTHWLYVFIGCIIYCLFFVELKKNIKIILMISVVVCFSMIIIYSNDFLYEVFSNFTNKLLYSIEEVSTEQEWSEYEINNSWRGFEIYQAKQQFIKGDFFQKIFGFGCKGCWMGKYSKLVDPNSTSEYIPVLHNGYYGMLMYTGIIGLIIYVGFFIRQIKLILKIKNKDFICVLYMIVLIGCMVTTYIVMGIVSSTSMVIYNCIFMAIFKEYTKNILYEKSEQVSEFKKINS